MRKSFLLVMLFLISISLFAQPKKEEPAEPDLDEQARIIDSIESSLHYKTGKIVLNGGIATINVPAGFKFLESTEAKFVLEDLWGNPPQSEPPLGLIFPANSGATDAGSYVFAVQFEKIGYVKDHDADKIDYDDLLKDMKAESVKDNEERVKIGSKPMNLVGWASKPYYDKEKRVLHWAKEYSVPGIDEHTLNYDVRVLGRRGVLSLQAISAMDQLDSVNNHINDMLAMVTFNEGHAYKDFDSNTDEIAAWTIGGLVAGKVLAKAGLWAMLLKFIKPILIGIGLLGAGIWRFVTGRKKKEPEYVYEPQPRPEDNNPSNPPA